MQIGDLNTAANRDNASLPTAPRRPAATNVSTAQEADEPDEAVGAAEPAATAEAGSQDAAVSISAAGASAAADDTGDEEGDGDGEASDSQAAQEAGDERGNTANASPARSFTYGVLGLERPEAAKAHGNDSYSMGRWLAAGVTIGGLISLFV